MTAALSGLHSALLQDRFVVTAELGAPRGSNTDRFREKARRLAEWVDAVNVTDNQSAVVRLAPWAAGLIARQEGLDVVMQMQCRDRNRLAMQSDLLGAGALGIENVLLLTGDSIGYGDHPQAKEVFDLDSVQLTWMARTLRDEGRLLSGRELSGRPSWLIGVVENPFAPPLAYRAQRLGKKVAAGAQFVQTQYIFDLGEFKKWMAMVVDMGLTERCSVLAGVGPVRSVRALEIMRKEVPGVYIPDDLARRLVARGEDKVGEEGIALCSEMISELAEVPGVAGVHVMAFGAELLIPEILERAGIPSLPDRQKEARGTTGLGGEGSNGEGVPLGDRSAR